MITKVKIIQVPRGNVQKLAASAKVSQTLVYNALAFRSYSDVSELIRKRALEEYGGRVTSKYIMI